MTISERIDAARRERRVLTRVSRAAWRLEQAERERTWALLVSARAEGISIRTLATAVGLSPSRVHQLVAAADLDALDAALGELRAAGWPAPEDPDSGEDTELDGRDTIAARLSDEVGWLRQAGSRTWTLIATRQRSTCARPLAGRTGAVVAADVDELARARRVQRAALVSELVVMRSVKLSGQELFQQKPGWLAPGTSAYRPRGRLTAQFSASSSRAWITIIRCCAGRRTDSATRSS